MNTDNFDKTYHHFFKIKKFSIFNSIFINIKRCADFVTINDDLTLCSTDQPRLVYIFGQKDATLKVHYRSLNGQQASSTQESIRGFNFYFEGI